MFKIVGLLLMLILVGLYVAFRVLTAPKSNEKILESYKNSIVKPKLTQEKYRDFSYRKLSIRNKDSLPTLVFVHGTIGSINDFSRYLSDSLLQQNYNMIAYDRIGYNYKDQNHTQESIAFEKSMLEDIIKDIRPDKTILVGYSYGGPIVLALKKKVKNIVLLAPAVYSKVEPMPWAINFYKWKLTRWLVPKIWKEASREKISHKEDLKNFEDNWEETPNQITSIHGSNDWIVPYENSKMLKDQFPEEQFKLVTIAKASHGLVWSKFDIIKKELLKVVD